MPIRWDSLIVRHLARELDEALAGARLRALRLDGSARDVALFFRSHTLLWRLHPDRGYVRLGDAVEPAESDLRLRARLRRIESPPDERIVRFELVEERGRRAAIELMVELLGNRWNAVVTEGPDRMIRHVLRRREGRRELLVGSTYEMPASTGRLGARGPVDLDVWCGELDGLGPESRAAALVRTFAWTSRLNAGSILGAASESASTEALQAAHERWRALAADEADEPSLIETDRGPQPYPVSLLGETVRPMPSLLAAFEAAGEASADGPSPSSLAIGPELMARLEEAVTKSQRRIARLERELDGLSDPAKLRAKGDLILARFAEIAMGTSEVALTDFDGSEVAIALDPKLPPNENADRYYDRAKRAVRAGERLPGLIEEAARAHRRLEELLRSARAGAADADELRAALPQVARGGRDGDVGAPLPYKTYRSSGGLEIRVGRGARHNDDLTFRHSSPGDVWLHAQQAAGAHVVLRWSSEGAPPARDLVEAATLAALHSRARTSGSVPVDWTFRKYVRKPRGAKPGSVVPDRVKTVFVEPDESLLETLADF